MRENQRGGSDNTSSGTQNGWSIIEKGPEAARCQEQETKINVNTEMNRAFSEGMVYIDIIPRFAL